jgi:hypothetical protein
VVAPLDEAFFDRPAREVAPDLLGCTLLRGGVGGVIVEVERYEEHDAASALDQCLVAGGGLGHGAGSCGCLAMIAPGRSG